MEQRKDHIILPLRERIRKVLLFRSGRMWQVRSALDSLREKYPDARIEVLCQEGNVEECAALPGVDHVIPSPGSHFSISSTPLFFYWKINRARYDLIAVVINNKSGYGYERVFNMLALIGAPFKLRYCPFTQRWNKSPAFMPGPAVRILLAPFVAVVAAVLTVFDLFPFKKNDS